jgi:hypothetical protein
MQNLYNRTDVSASITQNTIFLHIPRGFERQKTRVATFQIGIWVVHAYTDIVLPGFFKLFIALL